MSLSARLARAEGGLDDALLWFEVKKIAPELDVRPEEFFKQARETIARYWHLAVPQSGGRVDVEPVLRALADGEKLDYDELVLEVKRTLRRWRAREKRRRR